MEREILYCLLLSHVLCDFVLQTNSIVKLRHDKKFTNRIKGNLIHTLTHFTAGVLITMPYFSMSLLLIISAISIIHFAIDMLKSKLIYAHPFIKYSILFFLIDQLLHLTAIFSILTIYFSGRLWTKFNFSTQSMSQRLTLFAFILITVLWGTGIFIKVFISYLHMRPYKRSANLGILIPEAHYEGMSNGGFIIGILERLFIICSITLNVPEVIGFVLATKSIARFKRFDDDEFVEIFIIGSFISFICAIIAGVLIRRLKIFNV